jgi:hypothetical protein
MTANPLRGKENVRASARMTRTLAARSNRCRNRWANAGSRSTARNRFGSGLYFVAVPPAIPSVRAIEVTRIVGGCRYGRFVSQ